jgi:cyanophycinase
MLILIGGAERKEKRSAILREVCRNAVGTKGKLVLITAATQVPMAYMDAYLPVFTDLGVRNVDVLDVRSREDAYRDEAVRKLDDASVVFFTGGQQQRIGSQMGGTPVHGRIHELYRNGATIAGTSAGAAVMSDTMVTSGAGVEAPDVAALTMAPGLGLAAGMVIDSHFGQRGRIGRLMAAVAQNPSRLGVGIDEDTAAVMDGAGTFRVVGSGAVYVVDGTGISYSSLAQRNGKSKLALHDVRLHLLRHGDRFDTTRCRPIPAAG